MKRGHREGSQEELGTRLCPGPGLIVGYCGVVVGTKAWSGVTWANHLSSLGLYFPRLLVELDQDSQPRIVIE